MVLPRASVLTTARAARRLGRRAFRDHRAEQGGCLGAGFIQHHFCDGSQTNGGSTSPPFRYLRRESAAEKIRHKSGAGFTLVELIISISIFGILLGVTVYDFRIAQRHDDLRQAALKLASSLQEMQSLSMTGIVLPGPDGELPIGGYGVHIETAAFTGGDPTTFRLFGDRESFDGSNICTNEPNGRYDLEYCDPWSNPGECGCLDDGSNDDEPVSSDLITLPNDVEIISIAVSGDVTPTPNNLNCLAADCTEVDISFRPPKPHPYVGRNVTPIISATTPAEQRLTATVILKHLGIDRCRKVTVVGASGQISEELLEPADPDCPP